MPSNRFTPAHRPPAEIEFPATWCVFRDRQLLVRRAGDALLPPRLRAAQLTARPDESHYLGTLDGEHCYALSLAPEQPLPADTEFMGMRAFILEADDIIAAVAGRACQVLEWDRTHRHCGSCGGDDMQIVRYLRAC